VENVDIFYGNLKYFRAIWYIIWPCGILSDCFGIFFPFWNIVRRKIWQPCTQALFLFSVAPVPQDSGLVRQVHEGQLRHGQAPLRLPLLGQNSPDRSVIAAAIEI
jgi:hypothetical protein